MILHIDMDAFYASVEQLDNPALRGKCVIVGGTSNRGVVSAASYEAREYGVHSAMPIFKAKQKCPQGIYVHPRMSRYKEVSRQIMTILRGYSPLVEVVSIDEAYLDLTGCDRLHGGHTQIAVDIKAGIKSETGLTCSIGIAPVRFLAKIASDLDKPDGLTIIGPEDVNEFIRILPIQKVPGVGKMSGRQLHELGIRFLGDIRNYPDEMIKKRLGKFGKRLIDLSKGLDQTPVTTESIHKSVSSETTLAQDTLDTHLLKKILLKQSQSVARDLRKMGVRAKTITLKLKHDDFKLVTRRVTISIPTQSSERIYTEATKLLRQYGLAQKVRLVGVGASGFINAEEPVQLDMFNSEATKGRNWEKVDRALDTIKHKFGKNVVRRASLSNSSTKLTE